MTLDWTVPSERIQVAFDQPVAHSLMVPLAVIVLDVLTDNSPKATFAKCNHLANAL